MIDLKVQSNLNDEFDRARRLYPLEGRTAHEHLGVVTEQYYDLVLQVRSKKNSLQEFLELAVVCLRAYQSLGRFGHSEVV